MIGRGKRDLLYINTAVQINTGEHGHNEGFILIHSPCTRLKARAILIELKNFTGSVSLQLH